MKKIGFIPVNFFLKSGYYSLILLCWLTFRPIPSSATPKNPEFSCTIPLAKNRLKEKNQAVAVRQALRPSLKISLYQFPVENGLSFASYQKKVRDLVIAAKQQGSELIVLPELASLDLIERNGNEKKELVSVAKSLTPQYIEFQRQLSIEQGVAILGGTFPRFYHGKVRNSAIFTFEDGSTVIQDKLFLTPDEVHWGWEPGDTIQLIDSPWGKIAVLICYDCQFALISALLSKHAPDLILVPSMTGDEGRRRVRYAGLARAIEHYAYVAITGTVDSDKSHRDYSSQSVIIPPQDAGFPPLLTEGELDKPGEIQFNLDLARLRQSKARAGIYSGRDQVKRKRPIKTKPH